MNETGGRDIFNFQFVFEEISLSLVNLQKADDVPWLISDDDFMEEVLISINSMMF